MTDIEEITKRWVARGLDGRTTFESIETFVGGAMFDTRKLAAKELILEASPAARKLYESKVDMPLDKYWINLIYLELLGYLNETHATQMMDF